ncbi:MAG: hypothetical protein HQL74_07295 [Magnetococcales bacterium]|nr:hypothetical protein [Magnetococcales bacterium]
MAFTNSLFDGGRAAFMTGGINMSSDTIKAMLVDVDDICKTVTNATNATPIVITATSHGLTTGDAVVIGGVTGNTAANGRFRVTVTDANTFSLQGFATGANVAGNGAYVSGGQMIDLSNNVTLADITAGARIATSTLGSKTTTFGVFDAADVTFTSVTGDTSEALIIYKDTGTENTSKLILFVGTATGLPVTPSGGDVDVVWSSGQDRIFRL